MKKFFALLILSVIVGHPLTYYAQAASLSLEKQFIEQKIDQIFNAQNIFSAEQTQTLTSVLQLLPPQHYASLRSINVISDEHSPRGSANAVHLTLNAKPIDSLSEATSVLLHEIGHVVDLGMLVPKRKVKQNTKFKYGVHFISNADPSVKFYNLSWVDNQTSKKHITPNDFVSGYASYSPFEDFAESYLMYITQGHTFKDMTKQSDTMNNKYAFLRQRVFDGTEFAFQDIVRPTLLADNESRVFDSTLIPFEIEKWILFVQNMEHQRELAARTRTRGRARYVRLVG